MNAENAIYLPIELLIDVPEIDDQHAELFARLEQLKVHCIDMNCMPLDEADALFTALSIHCETEEHFAKKAEIDFSTHAFKHQKMLRGIYRTLQEVRDGRMDVFSLIRFIEYWFERHIIDEDKPLGVLLQASTSHGLVYPIHDRAVPQTSMHAPAG